MNRTGFNPRARWDVPIKSNNHHQDNPEILDVPIEVKAEFKGGRVFPLSFTLSNKKYPIERITYNWQVHQGQAVVHYFAVISAEVIYQISFNNTSLGWRLEKILT